MEQLVKVSGVAAPLMRINVDTDQIIPGPEIMASVDESYGRWGTGLFANWRYSDGAGGAHTPNPDFILNREPYRRAVILLADRNFGCGSSREPAPKALRGFGFRAVIAPSFGEIFQINSLKNGFLPIALTEAEVDKLFYEAASFAGFRLRVDLERQSVATVDSSKSFHFDIDPFRKHCLLNGLDEIGLSLGHADKIRAFEDRRKTQFPWYF